jgi:hypothetical protein
MRQLVTLNPNSQAGRADAAARADVNAIVARDGARSPDAVGPTVQQIPTGDTATIQQEIATRLRIDTRNMSPQDISNAIQQRTAFLSGVDPQSIAGQSTEDMAAANRQRSLEWLSRQPNSGINANNLSQYTYNDILNGYRQVYGMPADASWADIQQRWQERNAQSARPLIAQAGLDRPISEYYRNQAGLSPVPGGRNGTVVVIDNRSTAAGAGYDLNNDGVRESSHADIVSNIITANNPGIRVDVRDVRSAQNPDNLLFGPAVDSVVRDTAPGGVLNGQVRAINFSQQTFTTFEDLSRELNLPGLNATNIDERRGEVVARLQDLRQRVLANPAQFANSTYARDMADWAQAIQGLETLSQRGLPVFVAAGNRGPQQINVFTLANGVRVISSSTDGSPTSPMNPTVASNDLVTTRGFGDVRATNIGTQNGNIDQIDITGDQRPEFRIPRQVPPNGVTPPTPPPGPGVFVQFDGTSFAAPRALVSQIIGAPPVLPPRPQPTEQPPVQQPTPSPVSNPSRLAQLLNFPLPTGPLLMSPNTFTNLNDYLTAIFTSRLQAQTSAQ